METAPRGVQKGAAERARVKSLIERLDGLVPNGWRLSCGA